MKIVTAAEMREIDRLSTDRYGGPSLTLMENAGSAVADFVLKEFPRVQRIAVICGKGNNGGDGFVAARKLREAGREVSVILLASSTELRGDAAAMFSRLPVKAREIKTSTDLQNVQQDFEADLLIDAILGTGFRPPVSGLYADAIALMNATSTPVVAVDIPSGADADADAKEQNGLIAKADAIVTFTAPRPAHVFGQLTSGPTIIAPIGSPDEAIVSVLKLNLIAAKDIFALLLPRPRDSNKGMYGHVLVVGGSSGKSGATAMAGMSVLRSGAGLATVATAKSVLPTVASFHPELMTEALAETETGSIALEAFTSGKLDELADKKTVLAIGPGISRHPQTSELVRKAVAKYKTTLVLDADGLNAFEGCAAELNGKGRTIVITPHPGEMARLAGCSTAEVQRDRLNIARKFAREHELIVVLKGDRTLIAEPGGEVWVNTTGNPGMATGGTGDILTGMVAGFLAQNPSRPLQAVVIAVHLHGLAGDVARERMGEHSLVATDLLAGLPEAIRRTQTAASGTITRL
ncbi:MAG TPA: NAD(P)H-hydrate dehydratase [Terriglobales bacterium]|jgi:NAD(P)H-hydrate epimerase